MKLSGGLTLTTREKGKLIMLKKGTAIIWVKTLDQFIEG